jgi:tetratricopeptide (TPR) repeat protein
VIRALLEFAKTVGQIGIIQLHQGRFDPAVASFEKGLSADNDHEQTAELQHNLVYALQRLGRYAEARQVLDATAAADRSASSKPEQRNQE